MLATKVVAYRHGPHQDYASVAVLYVDVEVEEMPVMGVDSEAVVEVYPVPLRPVVVQPESELTADRMSGEVVLHNVMD